MRISDWSSDVCSSDLRDMLFCLRPILTAAGYPDPDMRKIVITDSSIREFSTYDGLTQAILDHDMPERTGTTVLAHYTDGGVKGIMQRQALWIATITLRLIQGELALFDPALVTDGYVDGTDQAAQRVGQEI